MAVLSVEGLFQQAREAMEQREWEKSRQLYLQALSLKPDSPDVHYGLASVCFQMDDLASAAYHFKEVTRLDPLRAGAYINLGAVYNLLEQPDDAIPALKRGIQLDPQRAEGHYNLGLVYRRKGQIKNAVESYEESLRVNPRMVDAHFNLANLWIELEEYGRALPHYKAALQLRPNWEKAAAGLQLVQQMLAETGATSSADKPASDSGKQAALIHRLHLVALESEKHGQQLLQILENGIEPARKEISAHLMPVENRSAELETCVQKFDTATQNLRSAHQDLMSSIDKLRALSERLMK